MKKRRRNSIETYVLKGGHINFPERILKKFEGKRIKMLETKEGVLLSPVEDTIKEARGILKGSRFNSESYFKQKQRDKEIES